MRGRDGNWAGAGHGTSSHERGNAWRSSSGGCGAPVVHRLENGPEWYGKEGHFFSQKRMRRWQQEQQAAREGQSGCEDIAQQRRRTWLRRLFARKQFSKK